MRPPPVDPQDRGWWGEESAPVWRFPWREGVGWVVRPRMQAAQSGKLSRVRGKQPTVTR